MKKFYLALLVCVPFISIAQNVGIGTTTPDTKLTVQTPTNNFGITHTDGTVRVGTYVGSSGGWLATQSYHPLYFSTGLLNGNNSAQMALQPNGNLGIGTINPNRKLTVQTPTYNFGIVHTDGDIEVGTFVGSGKGEIGTLSNHPFTLFTGGYSQMTILPNGNIGMGILNPANKLQIGGIGASGFSGNDLAIGNGTNAMALFQSNTSSQFASSTDIILMPKIFVGGGGRVGINVSNPSNKLQIGSMGTAGFNGNDLAIGNGTNALGIFQTNTASQFASSTDIILMPRILGGGVGKVGINTSTPRAPLDIVGVSVINTEGLQYSYMNSVSYFNGIGHVSTPSSTMIPNISIIASGNVYAHEFDAYSDARIKDIASSSNTTNDLRIINALQISDYTMKDKLQFGSKAYKKVIAQQVETVYPQVVSKHTDFVPNVYQLSTNIEKTGDSYTLNFPNKHNLSPEAKKLRVILPDGGIKEMNIVSIPSATQIVVNGLEIKGDKLFVYGEEVDDFRTVDYEGLTTLNISATQELSKLIDALNGKIVSLEKRLEELETKK